MIDWFDIVWLARCSGFECYCRNSCYNRIIQDMMVCCEKCKENVLSAMSGLVARKVLSMYQKQVYGEQ